MPIAGKDEQRDLIKKFLYECDNMEALQAFLSKKAQEHDKYWHYTKNASVILNSRELWLSNVCNQNDLTETKIVGKSSSAYYTISLVHGPYENLGAWSLYADHGTGDCLSFNHLLLSCLLKGTLCLYNITSKQERVLDKERFHLKAKDVIYYGSESSISGKYKEIFYDELKNDSFEFDRNKFLSYCKDYIWMDERETRVILELRKEDLADLCIENPADYIVKITHIDDFFDSANLQVISGPCKYRGTRLTISYFTGKIRL